MPSAVDRIDIAPPRDAGGIRSLGFALLIHAALIAALTWGVNWKRSDTAATFGAELWANTPQEAVPLPATTPPEALPLPSPAVKPPVEQPAPEPTPNLDIALEQEKKRKLLREQQLAQEKAAREKAKVIQAQTDKKAQQIQTAQLKSAQLKAAQVKAEQLAQAEQAKTEAQKAKKLQQATAAQRDDNLKRLNDLMAKTGGSPQGDNTSRASAGGKGSSKTYDAIANAAIMPNVVFTEGIDGNPVTVVEVRVTSDGTITSSKIVTPSGNKSWDTAVINGLVRTRVMPKDVDGKVPDTIFILSLRPRF